MHCSIAGLCAAMLDSPDGVAGGKLQHWPASGYDECAGGKGTPFRRDGLNYVGYGSYECRAPVLKYLPANLPPISLVGGYATTKPLLISNYYGDSSWGGAIAASPG